MFIYSTFARDSTDLFLHSPTSFGLFLIVFTGAGLPFPFYASISFHILLFDIYKMLGHINQLIRFTFDNAEQYQRVSTSYIRILDTVLSRSISLNGNIIWLAFYMVVSTGRIDLFAFLDFSETIRQYKIPCQPNRLGNDASAQYWSRL